MIKDPLRAQTFLHLEGVVSLKLFGTPQVLPYGYKRLLGGLKECA